MRQLPITLVTLAFLLAFALFGDTRLTDKGIEPVSIEALPTSLASTSEISVYRIAVQSQEQINALAAELDLWEARLEKGYVIAALTTSQSKQLANQGYQLAMDQQKSFPLTPTAPLDPRFLYFDDYFPNSNSNYVVDFMQAINQAHPQLTELLDIGDAWQAGIDGEHARDIWVLRVSNEDPVYGQIEDKPVFFLFATIHAREVATPELAIRYIRYLIEGFDGEGGYGVDPQATWLVDHQALYVLVMQNPDGHVVNEGDSSAFRRKNMDNDDGCALDNAWGVDLNRNHSFRWGCCGGSSVNACSETYRGPERASEPETQAFENFFATLVGDYNGPNGDETLPPAAPEDASGLFLSLHSYGDLVLWPYGFDAGGAPNEDQLRAIGRKFSSYNGYNPDGFLYTVDGATDDWTYGKFGVASFTFEVGPSTGLCGGFFPQYGCLDGINGMPRDFWAENKPAFLYAHAIARTPYKTVFGPDVLDLSIIPGVLSPGESAEITATIQDQRYAGDPLAPVDGAEYFIDAPGEDGSGTPMLAVDGSWGGLNEAATAMLDTSGLSAGRHYALVHGIDQAGDWGPLQAHFFYVSPPGSFPSFQGYVRAADNFTPLEATVSAGSFQAQTDPVSGHFSLPVIAGEYALFADAEGYTGASSGVLNVQGSQTITQNLYLEQLCTIALDEVESGPSGWTPSGGWAITDQAAHSPTHSWTDSPGGDYGNFVNASLTSPEYDLTGYSGTVLEFWHQYALETNYDYGYFEYSLNGGAWTQAAAYTGFQNNLWTQEIIALPELDGQSSVRLRFRLVSDPSVVADGWYLDDLHLRGVSSVCLTPTAPTAEFNAPTEAIQGIPVKFINLSTGSVPLAYDWDFGDGTGTSDLREPTYAFPDPGEYTVTMAVSNELGNDESSHKIMVVDSDQFYFPLTFRNQP